MSTQNQKNEKLRLYDPLFYPNNEVVWREYYKLQINCNRNPSFASFQKTHTFYFEIYFENSVVGCTHRFESKKAKDTGSQWKINFKMELKNHLRLLSDIQKDADVAVDLKFVVINSLRTMIPPFGSNSILAGTNSYMKST